MTELKQGGLMETVNEGGVIVRRLTDEGRRAAAAIPKLPSGEKLLSHWRHKLRGMARQMFEALVQAGGEPMSRGELAERAGTFFIERHDRDVLEECGNHPVQLLRLPAFHSAT